MHTLKNIFSLLLLFISLAAAAQENIRPTFDVRLEREVSSIKIDNKEYDDVVIEIDADAYKTKKLQDCRLFGRQLRIRHIYRGR